MTICFSISPSYCFIFMFIYSSFSCCSFFALFLPTPPSLLFSDLLFDIFIPYSTKLNPLSLYHTVIFSGFFRSIFFSRYLFTHTLANISFCPRSARSHTYTESESNDFMHVQKEKLQELCFFCYWAWKRNTSKTESYCCKAGMSRNKQDELERKRNILQGINDNKRMQFTFVITVCDCNSFRSFVVFFSFF